MAYHHFASLLKKVTFFLWKVMHYVTFSPLLGLFVFNN